MGYTVRELAEIAGVSPRTLRYYDQIGLLQPTRDASNGYRRYDTREVNALQQILFYRELGLPLEDIARLLADPSHDRISALERHLERLLAEQERGARLIETMRKTLRNERGEIEMSDREKFEGLKKERIEENERRYGAEVRAKYGDEVVDASNKRFQGMDRRQYAAFEKISQEIAEALREAVAQGDPAGAMAKTACEKHAQWIRMAWPEGMFTQEAHLALCEMYTQDERFRAYYEAIAPGGANFLLRAMKRWYEA